MTEERRWTPRTVSDSGPRKAQFQQPTKQRPQPDQQPQERTILFCNLRYSAACVGCGEIQEVGARRRYNRLTKEVTCPDCGSYDPVPPWEREENGEAF